MQSDEFKEKLEARKKARKKAQRNSTMRKKYIYQASFHRWYVVLVIEYYLFIHHFVQIELISFLSVLLVVAI